MNLQELEVAIKNLVKHNKILSKQNEILRNEIRTLKDIKDIEKLQRCYGYYFEHGMAEEVIDLFADGADVSLTNAGLGKFIGKEGVRRFFGHFAEEGRNPEFLHQVILVSPIIDVDQDGKTAKGRWYGLGTAAIPHSKGVKQTNMNVIYENDYVKEEGTWKLKTVRIYIGYDYKPERSFVKAERLVEPEPGYKYEPVLPDEPDNTNAWYPSGYIVPFHFKHPVTGKETSENIHNASLKKDDILPSAFHSL